MRRLRLAAWGACAAAAIAGGALVVTMRPYVPPSLPAPPAAAASSQKAGPAAPSARAVPRTVPTRVIIPAIGVNAAITPEGTGSSGALNMPPLTAGNLAAWWDGGAAPGQDGPAVIAGHVDSAQAGPLVFWNLRLLKPGDTVKVEPAGVTFTVTSVTQFTKSAFPTTKVYGPAPGPELRLITCGGTFDYATGHYLSNVIVYARETTA
jgi:sortase (surface protein transpeptidase)